MTTDLGRVPSAPGSHPPDEAPTGLRASRFDLSCVVKVNEWIVPVITVEHGDGVPDGRREIWARHEGRPQLDAHLVTVHYNYAYQDNSTIGGVAERIARLLAGSDSDRSGEAIDPATKIDGSTEGESAGPQDIAQKGAH